MIESNNAPMVHKKSLVIDFGIMITKEKTFSRMEIDQLLLKIIKMRFKIKIDRLLFGNPLNYM